MVGTIKQAIVTMQMAKAAIVPNEDTPIDVRQLPAYTETIAGALCLKSLLLRDLPFLRTGASSTNCIVNGTTTYRQIQIGGTTDVVLI